ncbi:MAG TPA: allophanate hydrolase [Balneola sp.]|nr:allophanate hydrolase [Balneola sp.]
MLLTFGSKDINLQKILQSIKESNDNTRRNFKSHEIKICYDLGLDWNEVENKTNLSKEEIISIHTSTQYSIAMFGFLPGFMCLEGLDQRIWVPRKDNPRTKVDSGSVGIGGEQTGIYSLESPGGWQIIGRTPDQFFDINNKTPTNFTAGDIITFRKISSKEFESLEKNNG